MSDDSLPRYDVKHAYKVGLLEKGLMTSYLGHESSDTKILSTALHIFCLDYGPKIRLGLSITAPEKKSRGTSRGGVLFRRITVKCQLVVCLKTMACPTKFLIIFMQ